ncbi:MAG: hypothetical protein M1819_001914 [Sarea resinae]|nr:MAG: hypothetical protein M1819_001914 [Sarea resinae]
MAVSAPPLAVPPVVTAAAADLGSALQDELHSFHSQHFNGSARVDHTPADTSHHLIEDDGLGYYPDGVKRTLTDQQIAMFRHSEIHALLRQRQRQRENQDSSEEGEIFDGGDAAAAGTEGTAADLGEEEEYARFLEKERQELGNQDTNHEKRKHSQGEGKEPRRIAREADESREEAGAELNYDDAPPPSNDPRQNLREDDPRRRRRVVYGEEDGDSIPAEPVQQAVSKSKVFLWPQLGRD